MYTTILDFFKLIYPWLEVLAAISGAIGLIVLLWQGWKFFKKRYSVVSYMHSVEEINMKFSSLLKKKDNSTFYSMPYQNPNNSLHQLDGSCLLDHYSDEMKQLTIQRKTEEGNEICDIKIPYKEIINFIDTPDAKITIDSQKIEKEFALDKEIEKATEELLEKIIEKKNPQDDPHPRMASLEKETGKDNYKCSFEVTHYFNQIRTNLSVDHSINLAGKHTTLRTEELKISPKKLPELSESKLANVVGVSAIWCINPTDPYNMQFYLLPRKKSVGVYENCFGMPSGDIECPKDNTFPSTSLVEYLKNEITREFTEETGIYDKNKDAKEYMKDNNGQNIFKKIFRNFLSYSTELEVIPLAFLREHLRGGKPQMFFLIKTKNISKFRLRLSFWSSQDGPKEFNNEVVSDAKLSPEVACNYLYAQAYLQSGGGGMPEFINVSN
jgi:hypothetical protein